MGESHSLKFFFYTESGSFLVSGGNGIRFIISLETLRGYKLGLLFKGENCLR